MSRRRASGPALATILWRDIPAQVNATTTDTTEKALLPNRFQVAIDRAAKVAGKTELAAYVAEWRRIEQPLDGDPATVIAERIDELDRTYTRDRLAAIVRHGGIEPSEGDA
ncbi:virulence factor [Nitriliruptor alkaliphilus]|uniref:virulence factor n=1 Tax=Nitriliruptor alkaliphilus TaxID=427918 RepID=UPI000698DFC1|nr:virulence factor [Nitriliruptor alkaliphilus]